MHKILPVNFKSDWKQFYFMVYMFIRNSLYIARNLLLVKHW